MPTYKAHPRLEQAARVFYKIYRLEYWQTFSLHNANSWPTGNTHPSLHINPAITSQSFIPFVAKEVHQGCNEIAKIKGDDVIKRETVTSIIEPLIDELNKR